MPGGGKGPSSSGNVTQTTINPTQQAQLPFLTGSAVDNSAHPEIAAGWNQALILDQEHPLSYFPGQTLANFNPAISGGYNDLVNQYGTSRNTADAGNALFGSATGGGMSGSSSPAYGGFHDLRESDTNAQREMSRLAGTLGYLGDTTAQPIATGHNAQQLDLANQSSGLTNLSGAALGNPYTGLLGNYAFGNNGLGGNTSALRDYGSQAAANPYAGQLAGMAGGSINGLGGGYGLLGHAGATAAQPNLATRSLGAEASGAFLGKNPYIDAEYGAATRPMVNAYQTATAPQTDSNFEAAGRYGSGVLGSARSTNEQNLGKALGDTASNLYGQDYANERGLMTSAQGTLGSLINQGNSLEQSAGSALGNLGLGEFGARTGAVNQAGNQYLSGLSTGIGANTAAGQLTNQDYATRGSILGNAGSLFNAGVSNAIGARQAAAGADSANLSSILSGIGAQQNAYTAAGQIENANLSGIEAGATGLQGGFDTGNRNSLIGLGMEPSVMSQNYTPTQQMIAGGQGLTSLEQQQINDAQNRYYGTIQAPWQQASQYMNLVGQPTTGSSSTRTPILGPNPASSALGTLGSLGSLGNNLGLFGGGGAGTFGSAAASTGPFAIGGGGDLGAATELGSLADFGGAAASGGGKGLADALPFFAL